ncbi:putative RNA-directed DNA polymerase from transposon X-element, partial [Trichonephila clavata]
ILDRFRLYPIGLSADIEKAFLQLTIAPEHREFLRFFYPLEDNREIVYRHCRVVFGVCSSPFLLAASLNHLLEHSSLECTEIISKLKHSFYVDNCVSGVFTEQEVGNFISSAKAVLRKGCFNLSNCESNVNGPGVSKCTGDTDLLGIIWNLDTLRCSEINEIPQNKGNTANRTILSFV